VITRCVTGPDRDRNGHTEPADEQWVTGGHVIHRRARAALCLVVLTAAGALLVILMAVTSTVVFFALLFGAGWR
jgi:hypothetical protein